MRGIAAGLAIAAVSALGGCATLTRGTSDEVAVMSEPAGAVVTTTLGTGCAATPCTLDVARDAAFTVTVAKSGYASQSVAVTTRVSSIGAATATENLTTAGSGSRGRCRDGRGARTCAEPGRCRSRQPVAACRQDGAALTSLGIRERAMTRPLRALCILLALGLAGCATLEHGTLDDVSVVTDPPGATWSRRPVPSCTSPCRVSGPRQDTFAITVSKPGYATQSLTAKPSRIRPRSRRRRISRPAPMRWAASSTSRTGATTLTNPKPWWSNSSPRAERPTAAAWGHRQDGSPERPMLRLRC